MIARRHGSLRVLLCLRRIWQCGVQDYGCIRAGVIRIDGAVLCQFCGFRAQGVAVRGTKGLLLNGRGVCIQQVCFFSVPLLAEFFRFGLQVVQHRVGPSWVLDGVLGQRVDVGLVLQAGVVVLDASDGAQKDSGQRGEGATL